VQPAHGRPFFYPAQPNLLLGLLQLLPVEVLFLLSKEPSADTMEIFFFVSSLAHLGQIGFWSASDQLNLFSKTSPQVLQRYSYKGIRKPPVYQNKILYPSIAY
jgi:hypothetical protein